MKPFGASPDPAQAAAAAERALRLIEDIYPLCRSITGDGVRATLARVAKEIPLEMHEVPTGTPVLDWEVPQEWNVRDAYVADESGRRVIDFKRHNLHLMGYSTPVRARLSLEELRPHLHTLPERPDWIPYRTSYYRRDWAFCLTHNELAALREGTYEVVVDSRIEDGHLSYGELLIPGESQEEVLLCTHVCHPSLANDNCTGIALLAMLGRALREGRPRLSYRLLFAPGTIGAITWLARNEAAVKRVRAGLVLGLLGDPGPLTYKRSRGGDEAIDRLARQTLQSLDAASRVIDFSPYGYDERQYCSPGFDLPVGRLTRSPNDGYDEYHTSADNLQLLKHESLAQSYLAIASILCAVDGNRQFENLSPRAEPRLGKRGLFRALGGQNPAQFEHALLWVLSQSDGRHGLNDIAAVSGLPRPVLEQAAGELEKVGLLRELSASAAARGQEAHP